MVSDQFLRLKRGDSFWYERKIGPQRFTKGNFVRISNNRSIEHAFLIHLHLISDQLRVIYNTTLSQIICRNSDDIEEIRRFVMEHRKDEPNDLIPCSDLRDFDFKPWNSNVQTPTLHTAHFSSMTSAVRVVKKSNSNETIQSDNMKSGVKAHT